MHFIRVYISACLHISKFQGFRLEFVTYMVVLNISKVVNALSVSGRGKSGVGVPFKLFLRDQIFHYINLKRINKECCKMFVSHTKTSVISYGMLLIICFLGGYGLHLIYCGKEKDQTCTLILPIMPHFENQQYILSRKIPYYAKCSLIHIAISQLLILSGVLCLIMVAA